MPKASPVQNSFNTGEITPILYGRTDFENYKNALKRCLNQVPYIQGGVTRRPGTYRAAEVKTSTLATRILPFKFSTTQNYIIEFGNLYVRFYRSNGSVRLTSQAITAITQANPGVVTYTGSDTYANGDYVDISGVTGMTEVNGRRFIVANVNVGANTFELTDPAGNVNTTAFTAYTAGGIIEEVYEVATTYTTAQLFEIKFTQSADVLYLTHPSHPPRKLSRTSDTAWTLTNITFLDGPYLITNATATTMTPSAATGAGVTLTASAITGINNDTGFQTTDVGRFIRLKEGSVWGYVLITGRTSTTVVTVTVINTLTNVAAKVNWRMGVWSDTTGYPSCVTFFEDRLGFAGSTGSPQRGDLSKTGDYENMAPSATDGTVANDNAVAFTLTSDDVQVIRWMKGEERALILGTTSGEWAVRPSSQSEALSPTNITAKQSTSYGSANTDAVRVGKAFLFIHKALRKLREMAYVYEIDGFRSPDMTILAEHITKSSTAATSGIKELAYQQEPLSLVWMPRKDGTLLGLTYERDQKVIGWHRHELGGYSNAGHTAIPEVESVAVIPSADGTRDELWMVVNRYINGRQVRMVEYMTKFFEDGDAQEDVVYLDCAATYDGASTTTISGLHHLAGETVSILADGATHPDKTVSATGTITLDRAALVVQVGYSYNSDGQMLRQYAGAADGTAQGKIQRSHRVIFRIHKGLGLMTGSTFNATGLGKLTMVTFRTSADLTDEMVPLASEDVEVTWEGDYTTENYVCWRWAQPLPGTVLAVMPQLHTQDR